MREVGMSSSENRGTNTKRKLQKTGVSPSPRFLEYWKSSSIPDGREQSPASFRGLRERAFLSGSCLGGGEKGERTLVTRPKAAARKWCD